MGGQLIQRYSIVGGGPSARTGLSVSYVVANPSTYLWLDDKRPGPQSPDQNKYKYGLDGMRERATLAGGSLTTQNADGRFVVHAIVPTLALTQEVRIR